MNRIGIFGFMAVTAAIIIGAAIMGSFVVTSDAQPTSWCAKPVGHSEGVLGACGFPSREQCRAFTEARSDDYACVPSNARR